MKKKFFCFIGILVMVLLAGCSAGNTAAGPQKTGNAEKAEITAIAETAKQAEASEKVEAAEKTENAGKTETIENAENAKPSDDVTIRIGGLTGPTSIGLIKVMEDSANGGSLCNYDFTIAGSADELTPDLIKGKLDIAAVPANLASVLYNNTQGKVKLLAINTLGVLYVAEKGDSIRSAADLKGRTIYATGKGSTPEYTLRYILSENGIDPDRDVTIEFKSEPTEVVALLKSSDQAAAMLPQPYVTAAQAQVEGLRIALDLTEEWDRLGKGSRAITGVLAVRADWAQEHPEALEAFLTEYKASVDYVNENVDEAAELVEKFGLFKAAVAKKAIPYCNIVFIAGEDMKAPMDGYLKVLFDANPKSVGGKLPDADFYY